MIKIDDQITNDKNFKAKMLLQIHDELIFECNENEKIHVIKLVKNSMISSSNSSHHKFSIPLEVSVNSGYNWGETQ